jgi:hypothetical protein
LRTSIHLWLATLLLASGCTSPPVWTSHRQLLDHDLESHDSTKHDQLEGMAGKLGFKTREDFRGWLAYTTVLRNDHAQLRWVFVWLEPAFKMPGYSRVRAGVLDSDGHILDDSIFLAGWRHMDFAGVAKIARPEGLDVLLIRSEGLHISNRWQYYALAGDHLELVRLEDGKPAKLHANYYRSPNHTVGPIHPPADEDECVRILEGPSWTRRISVLSWLAGIHWDGTDAHLWHEDEKISALALRLQSSPRIHATVESLLSTQDTWTREAAFLALNPDR